KLETLSVAATREEAIAVLGTPPAGADAERAPPLVAEIRQTFPDLAAPSRRSDQATARPATLAANPETAWAGLTIRANPEARRNLILMVLSVETMLQGVALNLVAFARFRADLGGQVLTLFVLTVAACEAAVALTLIVMLYHRRHSLDVSVWQDLREPGQEAI